ncbi:MAG: branched-chain amino acid ABC transporter permease [Actinomycetota bacterium]
MDIILQALISGLLQGSVYAMLAVAFSIIYMTTRTINFALGPQMLIAALIYFTLTFGGALGAGDGIVPLFIALPIAIVASVLIGLLVHTLGLRPLGQFDPNSNIGWILTTLAIGLILVEGGRLIFHETNRPVPPIIETIAGQDSIINIPPQKYLIFIVGIALAIALETLHRKTKLGRGLRATAHDRNTASLMGINTNFMILYSFGLAGAIAAVAAWLLIPVVFVDFNALGTFIGLKAFVGAVVGGIGSTRGALVGGLVVGLAESMTVVFQAQQWGDAVVFVLLILILMVKPTGILGEARIEKV